MRVIAFVAKDAKKKKKKNEKMRHGNETKEKCMRQGENHLCKSPNARICAPKAVRLGIKNRIISLARYARLHRKRKKKIVKHKKNT